MQTSCQILNQHNSHLTCHKGTWRQAVMALLLPIGLALIFRWLIIEPFVIPSRSMEPTLLEQDYIVVNKFVYGLRLPFTSVWLQRFRIPHRGEVVVFRNVNDSKIYFVKRVIGLPGDVVQIKGAKLFVNNEQITKEIGLKDERVAQHIGCADSCFILDESFMSQEYKVIVHDLNAEYGPSVVPEDSLFVLGDNRDESSDSRVWGFLPLNNLLGKAILIWMSCNTDEISFLCASEEFRKERIFSIIR